MGGTRAGPPAMPYHPMSMDTPDASTRYRNRDGNSRGRGRGRGHSSRSDRYDQELPQGDDYGGYGGSQVTKFLIILSCLASVSLCFLKVFIWKCLDVYLL